jgi:peptide/nickel transport system permease protein
MNSGRKASQSYWALAWRQLRRNRLAMAGLAVVVFLFMVAILAELLANDKPLFMRYQGEWYFPAFRDYPEFIHTDFKELAKGLEAPDGAWFPPVPYSYTEYSFAEVLEKPTRDHWLGTDDRGRDVLARVIHGSRISLSVGFVAVGIYMIIGIIIGSLAGYYGGKVDLVISRVIEIIMCFPAFIFIISLVAFLEPSIYNIMIAIGLIGWTDVARLIRGEFLKIRNQEYVEATRALGARDWRTIFRHILPNALAPALVVATFGIAAAIIYESALSFLGFGVQPPTPSWGDILSQSRSYYDFAWWLTIFPGTAIFITVTAFNLVNEGLRDAIDPRLKES